MGERVGLLDALRRPAPALPPTLVEARRGHPSLPWDVGPARGPQARCPWAGLLPSATPASLAASDQQAGFGADRAAEIKRRLKRRGSIRAGVGLAGVLVLTSPSRVAGTAEPHLPLLPQPRKAGAGTGSETGAGRLDEGVSCHQPALNSSEPWSPHP